MIPVLVASVLGLLHGAGPTLTSCVSLILGRQIGSMFWCELAHVIHKHIVYSIIYCAALISIEVCDLLLIITRLFHTSLSVVLAMSFY